MEEDEVGDINKNGKFFTTKKGEGEDDEEISETQRSNVEAVEEDLYDNLNVVEMYEESLEDHMKIGRQHEAHGKSNITEDDSSYQSDADEEDEEQVYSSPSLSQSKLIQLNFEFAGGGLAS